MRIGIFGDVWTAATGFAVVLTNIAKQLATHKDLEVYYFGRFGCKEGFEEPQPIHNFVGVNCQGGIWDRELVIRIIKKFKLDLIFTEDDWFSIEGIFTACKFWHKPFYWLSPIDSIPVRIEGLSFMRAATKIFVPSMGATAYLKGKGVDAVYRPHGCDTSMFYPFHVDDKPDDFTFVWSGRDSRRKALGRVILAFEQLTKTHKAKLLIRTDWRTPQAQLSLQYINVRYKRNSSVITEQMTDTPHKEMARTYNRGDCYLCSSKAGGFEMGCSEANACQLPILVSNHTFMNERVIDSKNGYLINISKYVQSRYGSIWANIDIKDLISKMKFYVEHPEIAELHGNYGMSYVNKFFKWKTNGDIIYNEITS